MDRYRLPPHVAPTRYDLCLIPDLASSTFSGEAVITVTVSVACQELVLNAADLDITSASLTDHAGNSYQPRIELDETLERGRFIPPTTISPGEWMLHLAFCGTLNDKLRGFYRSTYKDHSGQSKVLAATQFEATDARRAFPCWDEPAFKAVFATSLAIEPHLTAVSNTAIKAERSEAGKTVLQFEDTIPMSTYLVAFIVGEIEAADPIHVGGTPVRVWSVPGKRHLSRFSTEIAAFSLRFFEEYYDQPYPGDKLDLLAIPDFASGAMENFGAITFRETTLLIDEREATHAELERVADVVAHENAHMWFGDLVTMTWWNGLWLNEAFATFMEMLAVDAWKPEWDRWATFGASRAAALSVDGLQSTRPIEYQVRAPSDADAMFDVLTYEKGASVLRMLEQYMGPEVFREGVRAYLRAHAYKNADTGDLWDALGQAARQPVPVLMDRWIFGEGYPLIRASVEEGSTLVLRQQRFTYLPTTTEGQDEARWQIPIQVRITATGQARMHRVLLTDGEMTLPLPSGFESVLVNEGGHGFYRVGYSPELLQGLLARQETLGPIERFNLVNDAWAATMAGLMPLTEYLDLTAQFRSERDRNVWAILIESFHSLNRIIQSRDREALEAFVRDRTRSAAEALGWSPLHDETELTRQLRGDLLRALGTLGNDHTVQNSASDLYAAHCNTPGTVDPNVLSALIAILAHAGDSARYEDFLKGVQSASTPQEERRYLYALAAFRPVTLLERTLARTINGEIRTQDAPFVVSALLMNVYGRELAWEFVQSNWETLDRLFPKQGLRRMCGGVIGLASPSLERDVREFFESRKIDLGGKILAQYLEQLRIVVAFRERNVTALRQYLASFGAS